MAKRDDIKLAVERFFIDTVDDFFPDPLQYADLRLLKKDLALQVYQKIKTTFDNDFRYVPEEFYHWDVPKNNYVIRHAIHLHPIDRIVYNYILICLLPLIEGKLSKARYSYIVKDFNANNLFGNLSVDNWVRMKDDIRGLFKKTRKYNFLVSTDIAGFFEYIHHRDFRKQICHMTGIKENSDFARLIDSFLANFSLTTDENIPSGIPQNYDASSYLTTAFLDFLDKDLEASKLKHFRYVDDIKVACKMKEDAQKAIIKIIHSLRKFNLNVSTYKTEIWNKSDDTFKYFLAEFPEILDDIDNACSDKNVNKVNKLLPKLVEISESLIEANKSEFDDKLFRASVWRIVKCYRIKNIKKINLSKILNKSLKLLQEIPGRTDTFTKVVLLAKNNISIQQELRSLIQNSVYPWQEMKLWEVLIQADRIREENLLYYARKRLDNDGYPEAARNFAIIFLGKHGTYNDRDNIAQLLRKRISCFTKRCAIIALQEYSGKKTVYSFLLTRERDIIIKGLINYLNQQRVPIYFKDTIREGTEIGYIS